MLSKIETLIFINVRANCKWRNSLQGYWNGWQKELYLLWKDNRKASVFGQMQERNRYFLFSCMMFVLNSKLVGTANDLDFATRIFGDTYCFWPKVWIEANKRRPYPIFFPFDLSKNQSLKSHSDFYMILQYKIMLEFHRISEMGEYILFDGIFLFH